MVKDAAELIKSEMERSSMSHGKFVDFSVEIFNDLVEQGFEGNDLIQQFQEQKSQIRPAVRTMIAESKSAAKNTSENGDELMEEVFGDLEE